MTTTLSDRKLSIIERICQLENEAIITEIEDLLDDLEPTPEEMAFIQQRIAEMEADPDGDCTWEEVLEATRPGPKRSSHLPESPLLCT